MLSGSAVELHCKDKLSVPPATYSWYKDNKPLAPGHTPDSHYSLDTHTGALVRYTSGLNGSALRDKLFRQYFHINMVLNRILTGLSRILPP